MVGFLYKKREGEFHDRRPNVHVIPYESPATAETQLSQLLSLSCDLLLIPINASRRGHRPKPVKTPLA